MKSPLSHFLFFAGLLISALALLVQFWAPVQAAPSAAFTVNNSGDASDASPGNGVCATSGGVCTLRAAIEEANALAGHDTITIGAATITPATPLPALTDDAGATIKGNNVTTFLDGSSYNVTVGLNLESDNNIIQGLLIWNFTQYGIRVWWSDNNLIGTNGDGVNDAAERNVILRNGTGIFLMGGINRVAGNYVGVFGTGALASPNGTGIYVEGALDANCETVIGTNGDGTGDAAEGNLISGNTNHGVYIHNSCVAVAGNIIGLNATGTAALPNTRGILVDEYAPGTRIGTDGDGVSDALERNIISGNSYAGIEVSNGAAQVTIAGNTIGLNPAGDTARPNQYGIYVTDSSQITIGTNDDGSGDDLEGNLISGNTDTGIVFDGANCTQNAAAGNWIGTDSSGFTAIPNPYGIVITNGAHHNLIGNDGDGQGDMEERNLISGNQIGVGIDGAASSHNTVAGNWIGTNDDGSGVLANTSVGIFIYGAPENLIGGQVGNLISGNDTGISIAQSTAISNTISFNRIGLNAAGNAALPNQGGIQISAPNNLVGRRGDTNELDGNTISGNTQYGVLIAGMEGYGNMIAGNQIGTDADGLVAIPNGTGIHVSSAPANLIGTDGDGVGDANERNLISGNTNDGILIQNSGADGNIVAGNDIGVNAAGNAPIKNGSGDWGVGVKVVDAPNTRIGTDGNGVADAAERNIISGNNVGGVQISGDYSYGSVLAGNYIGTNRNGLAAIPNGTGFPDQAVMIADTGGVRVGTNGDGLYDAAERNVIAGNLGWGIRVFEGSGDHLIAGNYIGVSANGSSVLGNSKSGIYLDQAYGIEVGGTTAALQNTIANNGGDGITVGADPASTREVNNVLRGNAIYANTGLGIDLGNDGVTANDPGDADSGPNALQNFPVLTAATSAATTTITGTLDSKANASYWIDFYTSPTCDSSGYGEGQIYLGSHTVTTNASGVVAFSVEIPAPIAAGFQVTATATGADKGSSSEFSHCIAVEIVEFRIYLPLVIR